MNELASISISAIHLLSGLPQHLGLSITSIYARAFAAPPWNEAYVDKDGKYYGLEFTSRVDQLRLKPAYPQNQVYQYLTQELSQSHPILIVAEKSGSLLGFCWGFTISISQLVDTKYQSISSQDRSKLVRAINHHTGRADQIFYFSECAVDPKYQNQGIGTLLVTSLYQHHPQNFDFLVRTHHQSPMVHIVENLDHRIQKVIGPHETIQDPLNQDRVLFCVKPLEQRFSRPPNYVLFDMSDPGQKPPIVSD